MHLTDAQNGEAGGGHSATCTTGSVTSTAYLRDDTSRGMALHQFQCQRSRLLHEVELALARYCRLFAAARSAVPTNLTAKSENESEERKRPKSESRMSHEHRSLWECVLELVELSWAVRTAEEHEALVQKLRPECFAGEECESSSLDLRAASKAIDFAIKAAVRIVNCSTNPTSTA